jgi:hypothetical protein
LIGADARHTLPDWLLDPLRLTSCGLS